VSRSDATADPSYQLGDGGNQAHSGAVGSSLRLRRTLASLALVLSAAVLASCDSSSHSADMGSRPRPAEPTTETLGVAETPVGGLPPGLDGVVTSVTDGDTIRVRVGEGADERVRLIGIDTPETRDPRTAVECFGREASAQTAVLLPVGTRVRLERDVEPRDRYGRVLAYVWRVDDVLHVNEALVSGGWAVPYRFPPNVKYADRFSALGADARRQGAGLWGVCGNADTPASAEPRRTGAPAAGAPAPDASASCDGNYEDACVPVSSTDLDCADVGAHRFRVVGNDPHGFDGDGDGIACE
jgi:micrococcal nuclease